MNRSALLRRPPLLQAAVVVLLTSAFMLPAARAEAEKAQTEPGQASAAQAPLTQGEIKAQREFKLLDFNRDGKLSRSEVALFPRLAAAFDEADTDRDGFVSYEEVKAFAVKYRAERDKARAAEQAQAPADPQVRGESRP